MIILIPFLLLSAVFSQTAILNLHLPEGTPPEAMAKKNEEPTILLPIVSILDDGFVLNDGEKVLAVLPKKNDEYNFEKLSKLLLEIKQQFPEQEDIILLSQAQTRYDVLIHAMDAVREIRLEQNGQRQLFSLFPNVSIGEVGKIQFTETQKAE